MAFKGVFRRVEIAFVARGMALDAHEVGVLVRLAPVQRILEVDPLAWIEMKPPVLLGIPGHAQGLQPAFADLDQVLLKRCDAEGVGDLEVGVLAINPRRVDPEIVTLARKHAGLFFGLEGHIVEVPEHRVGGGRLHRQLVMGALPVLDLLGVAALAWLLIDHRRRCRSHHRFDRRDDRRANRDRLGRGGGAAVEQKPANRRHGQQQYADGDGKQLAVDQGRARIRVRVFSFIFMLRHCDFRSPSALAVQGAL